MKKHLIGLLSLFPLLAMAAISPKYATGYTFDPSQVSTENQEYALSPYKDGQVVYLSGEQVYVAHLDSTGELSNAQVCPDFVNLTITGQVAYDSLRQKLYYSQYNEKYKANFLYESVPNANGVWQPGTKMRILGTQPSRTDVSFVQSAGWNYRNKVLTGFYNPVLSADGQRLFYSSLIDGGKGGKDLYYSQMVNEDERVWSAPVNVADWNSEQDEDWLTLCAEDMVYFSSNRAGASSVYVSFDQDSLWTEPVALGDPINATGENYKLLIQQETPLLVTSRSGVQDIYLYHAIPEPEPEPEPVLEVQKREFYWVFFLFDFDKDALRDSLATEVDALAKEMAKFPDCQFEVAGYTDSRGPAKYNEKLSLRRAQTICQMLQDRGFAANRLVAVGYGESRLQVPNAKTNEEHALNRRVEVRIISTDENTVNVDPQAAVIDAPTSANVDQKVGE